MIKNVLVIFIVNIEIEQLFNITQDIIIYQRDQLNKEIIEIIIMIKFDLFQH